MTFVKNLNMKMLLSNHPILKILKLHYMKAVTCCAYRSNSKFLDTIDELSYNLNNHLENIVKSFHQYARPVAYNLDISPGLHINCFIINDFFGKTSQPVDISTLRSEKLDKIIFDAIQNGEWKKLSFIVTKCQEFGISISKPILRKLFNSYSLAGKPHMIMKLQNYVLKDDETYYLKNGGFRHFLAKAECYRGNPEKGLKMIKDMYIQEVHLRKVYNAVVRELIIDAVKNRSEATLFIFKKYAIELWVDLKNSDPLLSLWFSCWTSCFFKDQVFSDELLEEQENLRTIVIEKAHIFAMASLQYESNEDAVARLLQTLLKYEALDAYAKVLAILFDYKLHNKDTRGCTEIVRNCYVLGIELSQEQRTRYIKMVVHGDGSYPEPSKPKPVKDFKLKF